MTDNFRLRYKLYQVNGELHRFKLYLKHFVVGRQIQVTSPTWNGQPIGISVKPKTGKIYTIANAFYHDKKVWFELKELPSCCCISFDDCKILWEDGQ